MKIDARLHYHDNTIHIEFFEDKKLVEHSCIAKMNSHNESPLLSIFKEQICRRWNTQDVLIKAIKHCRDLIGGGEYDVHEQDAVDCLSIIDTALDAAGGVKWKD